MSLILLSSYLMALIKSVGAPFVTPTYRADFFFSETKYAEEEFGWLNAKL